MDYIPTLIFHTLNFKELQKKSCLRLLKMHYESGVGHIGGNLSALDALLYLYHYILQKDDQFILSKGHSSGALYIALWTIGKISEEELSSFHKDNTKLAGHPVANWIDEIPFATGSLGHGLGLAAGVSLGNKLQKKSQRVFCLMSDGEWQEGSNWESLIFLNHHQLNNLTVLVDCNGLQGFGTTKEVASMDLERLQKLFSEFDLVVDVIDGHKEEELKKALSCAPKKPHIILMNTRKGNGVSFMENQMQWHYLPLTSELYHQAKMEIEAL